MSFKFLKIVFATLLLVTLAKAQTAATQVYSQLQETYWQGEFQVLVKNAKGKLIKPLQKFPIEISFLKMKDDKGVDYTFRKDISKATENEGRGFGELDTVPCGNPDGSQEPRHISLSPNADGTYSGKINLNDCKPDKKGKARKEAKVMPIKTMSLSEDGKSLAIQVTVKEGIIIEINYTLKRVDQKELKFN